MWLLALLSCVGLMICGTPAQGDPPNGDELQLTTQPVVTAAAEKPANTTLVPTTASSRLTGSGTESDPYLIQSAGDMVFLSTTTNYWGTLSKVVYYELTADITIVTDTWTPIGNGDKLFYGKFDGCGHEITLMSTSDAAVTVIGDFYDDEAYLGFWGMCSNDFSTIICNLSVNWSSGVKFTCNTYTDWSGKNETIVYIGGVAGFVVDIKNVKCKVGDNGFSYDISHVNADSNKGYDIGILGTLVVGGVVGFSIATLDDNDPVASCLSFEGSITCNLNSDAVEYPFVSLGGVAGYIYSIDNAKFVGSISCSVKDLNSSSVYVGGIASMVVAMSSSVIDSCFVDLTGGNLGSVNYFGGICGSAYIDGTVTVSNCYFDSSISIGDSSVSDSIAGTMFGESDATTITNCKYDSTITLNAETNNKEGTGVSNLDLKNGTYGSGSNKTNIWTGTWATNTNWHFEEGKYPELKIKPEPKGTAFTVTFSADTPKGGLFLYVLCIDSTGASKYSEIRQYYFEGINETETIYYKLTEGANYKVLISKPYVWEFTIEGTTDLSGTAANGQFTFTAPAPDVGGTVTITASGGTPPNNFAVV